MPQARLVVVIMLCAVGSARAEDPISESPAEPWAVGITDDQKRGAQALLEEGNTFFLANQYGEALAKYREAIAIWDHPAIRFNVVRSLIQLGRLLEADENLTLALKYGKAPLKGSVFEEALAYQKLLKTQIAEIGITCDQQAVSVTFDGQPLLSCPGRKSHRLLPGRHQLVARKAGFLTVTRDLFVVSDKPETVAVSLMPLESAGVTKRRWKQWKPWSVVAGGGALLLIGGLLEWKASSDFKAFDKAIDLQCGAGCTPPQIAGPVADLESRAKTENGIAVVTMVLGGATAIAGAVLVTMNRAYVEYPTEQRGASFTLVPSNHGGLVGLSGRF